MKKKILFIVLTTLGICGGITASQVEVQVFDECTTCCEQAEHTNCYIIDEIYGGVYLCNRGLNVCDSRPPIE
mgnify:CR=1 FL=1